MAYGDLEHEPCSIARPVALLGDRWTLIVLRQAFAGVRRFEEFQTTVGLSRSLLSERLGRLVEADILERSAYRDERRTRHEYRLTDKGRDLYPVLMALRTWGDKYLAPDGPFQVYRHRDCGGRAELRHVCDQCGAQLSVRDVCVEAGPGLERS
ncbi:winged helix-turn-helix transcriptional regulator [Pseudonocardia sp. Cha107L01]|uniref:winged helix-turn-helix transcriptional regulator n=1 Tax=Pseudonocardia sp. Cha107L01 TaxID=3457576 RepID=UPI00403E90DF